MLSNSTHNTPPNRWLASSQHALNGGGLIGVSAVVLAATSPTTRHTATLNHPIDPELVHLRQATQRCGHIAVVRAAMDPMTHRHRRAVRAPGVRDRPTGEQKRPEATPAAGLRRAVPFRADACHGCRCVDGATLLAMLLLGLLGRTPLSSLAA